MTVTQRRGRCRGRRRIAAGSLAFGLVLAACSSDPTQTDVTPEGSQGASAGTDEGSGQDVEVLPGGGSDLLLATPGLALVDPTPISGNRFFDGLGAFGAGAPIRLPLSSPVSRVLLAPVEGSPDPTAAGALLVVALGDAGPTAWIVTHLAERGTVAVASLAAPDLAALGVPQDGDVLVVGDDGNWRFGSRDEALGTVGGASEPLPDGITVAARDGGLPGSGRTARMVGPTDRYGHGVLGDDLEADAVLVEDPTGPAVDLSARGVFETRLGLWADLDSDGREDLFVTESDEEGGAGIVAFRSVGDTYDRVEGAAIGSANRWRHLIAVAPLPGPDGIDVPTVVEVVTPHLNRTLELSQWDGGDRLASVYSLDTDLVTHSIGLRDLDRAAVLDADGDGVLDLVAPSRGGMLAAIALADGGARDGRGAGLRVDIGGDATSNLAVAAVPNATAPGPGRPPRLAMAIAVDGALVFFPG